MNYKIQRFTDNLSLITLPPVAPGFQNFIGVWLYKGEKTFIVDVGTSSTSDALMQAIGETGAKHLDYIFLTHIHVDHAGAIGEISGHFPDTPVICHKDGMPHLADPGRLWEGTKKTLGSIATAYGPIKPVPPDRLVDASAFNDGPVIPVITPGHSLHHISYVFRDYLFAGEAGGVCYPLRSGREYMRPATPPKFFLDIAIDSIDDLISKRPEKICYGHLGLKEDAVKMLNQHKEQLYFWENFIRNEITGLGKDDPVSRCMRLLLEKDPLLAGFADMEEDVQEREKIFLLNSIKGFAGWILFSSS
ncbi:MAG: MBL fold metallo-hydrolase [Proteobacteria bacterium]|nr:MBL fold metallo-hydrolase [Pseudomonadota bacterium]MBU1568947.1 MBL fold metallo-hydrolase [Pseudomonadota bacterium]